MGELKYGINFDKSIRKEKKRIKKLSYRVAFIMILNIMLNLLVPLNVKSAPNNLEVVFGDISYNEEFATEDGLLNIKKIGEKINDKEIRVTINIKNQLTVSNVIVNEILTDGFNIIDDSVEVTGVENKDILKIEVSGDKKEIKIESGDSNIEDVTVSFNIALNEGVSTGENISVVEKSTVKYSILESNEVRELNITKILVDIKEVVNDEAANENEILEKEDELKKDETVNSQADEDKLSDDGSVKNQIDEEEKVAVDETIKENEAVSNPEISTFAIEPIESQLLNVTPTTIDFPVTIRDFKGDYILFETIQASNSWLGKGMVSTTLGTNKKPIFLESTIDDLVDYLWSNKTTIRNSINNLSTNSYPYKVEILNRIDLIINYGNGNSKKFKGTYDDAASWYEGVKNYKYDDIKNQIYTAYRYIYYHMNKFFEDTSGDNTSSLNKQDDSIMKKLTLNNISGSNKYRFASSEVEPYKSIGGFFPADKIGFGNEGYTGKGGSHNFHFTLESHSKFWVPTNETLTFTFNGDDDIWVYIDGKLVIDLGGIHSTQGSSFTISNGVITTSSGNKFTVGTNRWVDFDLFYMERHTTESNLTIETNINFIPNMTVEKQAFLIDDRGNEQILNDKDLVYPGETVYYKFILRNKGNVNLTDIEFQDTSLLNIKINKNGVYNSTTGTSIAYRDLTVLKNGVVDTGKLGALASLELAQGKDTTIEIKSKDFLKYTVNESDIPTGSAQGVITNRVVAKANYFVVGQGTLQEASESSVTVIPKPITETIVTLNATIVKTIDKVIRKGITIYPNSSNSIPNILPNDVVTFKFVITNKSTSRNSTTGGCITWVSIAIEGVKLVDTLTIGDKYTNTNLNFYKLDGSNKVNFADYSNFKLEKQEVLTLYSDWNVTNEEANYYKYKISKDVTNKVELFKFGGLPLDQYTSNIKKLGESQVQLKIQPPSIKIQNKISMDSLSDSDGSRTFTIMVKGSNGTQYNIEATKDIEYTLDNLKYGVTYTISEIVPMNYQLVSIKFDTSSEDTIMLSENNIGSKVVITNKKINNQFWFHDTKVTSIFKYLISGV